MLVYFTAYGIISVLTLILTVKNVNKKSINKTVAITSFIIFVLILGLRHPTMGIDLGYGRENGYISSFEKLSKKTWGEIFSLESFYNYEYGYILFNKLVGSIWANTQFFLFICAFVSLVPVFYVIYKNSDNTFMSIVVMLGFPSFLMLFSGLRQAISIGLCVLALKYIQDKKIIKFIITVVVAGLFHSSAYVFLIAYPLYNIKFSSNARWFSVMLLPIIYVLKDMLFAIFSKLFKDNASTEETGALTLFLVFCLVYVFCIILYDGSKKQNGLLNLFFFACCCQACGSVNNLAVRVTYYFMTALIFLLPDTMKKAKIDVKERSLLSIVIYFAFIIFGLYSLYTATWPESYPYYFFWEIAV